MYVYVWNRPFDDEAGDIIPFCYMYQLQRRDTQTEVNTAIDRWGPGCAFLFRLSRGWTTCSTHVLEQKHMEWPTRFPAVDRNDYRGFVVAALAIIVEEPNKTISVQDVILAVVGAIAKLY